MMKKVRNREVSAPLWSLDILSKTGIKLQSKTLFLAIFDQRSSVVLKFPIAVYPVCDKYPVTRSG